MQWNSFPSKKYHLWILFLQVGSYCGSMGSLSGTSTRVLKPSYPQLPWTCQGHFWTGALKSQAVKERCEHGNLTLSWKLYSVLGIDIFFLSLVSCSLFPSFFSSHSLSISLSFSLPSFFLSSLSFGNLGFITSKSFSCR